MGLVIQEQNLPLQMSLWHAGYFVLGEKKNQDSGRKTEEETLTFLLTASKNLDKKCVPWNRAITRDICRECGPTVVGATLMGCVYSASHFFYKAQQTRVQQTLVFPSPCELPSFPSKSQTSIRNILFYLQLEMIFKVRVLPTLMSYSVFLGLSHVCLLLTFCLISSVDLYHVDLLLRPARRTQKRRGKFLPPQQRAEFVVGLQKPFSPNRKVYKQFFSFENTIWVLFVYVH